ncbi:phosphoadenosine phosphosulfate reductase family protein [Paenibacillus agilis]|uniref:Phosphoadenosine phosphosulfate reductase n=1 Tax=Paenibacillus agilis TaxID=3020863 RepID=A0A559IXB5_9BACL|nr:phosphoadenosine phosphosulfate reductase family protein [Paenibacillus agilis]TVX92246.1 phosphoadenosine phosphosulfate reductase [Paenibacillus agilis]
MRIPDKIFELINQGAVFYVSHSGGKDSQAMYAMLVKVIPHAQIVVVHADLGAVEWPGVQQHIVENTQHPMNVVQAVKKDGQQKTLLGMVSERGKWPSSSCRQCTSDLKRDPIMKFIRHDLKARGSYLAVNCIGIRATESTARAKKEPLKLNVRESKAGRQVYDWMPIFDLATNEVFQVIRTAGQEPFWAYEKNERLSCVFCIMGSINDLKHGAEKNQELYRTYVELEKQIGHTMFQRKRQPVSLEEYIGVSVS